MIYNLINYVLSNDTRYDERYEHMFRAHMNASRNIMVCGLLIFVLNIVSVCLLLDNTVAKVLILASWLLGNAFVFISSSMSGGLYGVYVLNQLVREINTEEESNNEI